MAEDKAVEIAKEIVKGVRPLALRSIYTTEIAEALTAYGKDEYKRGIADSITAISSMDNPVFISQEAYDETLEAIRNLAK